MRYAQEPAHEAIIHSADIEHGEVNLARDQQRIHDTRRDVFGPWVARIQGRTDPCEDVGWEGGKEDERCPDAWRACPLGMHPYVGVLLTQSLDRWKK